MTKIIVLRGNSGSGKSTMAKRLRDALTESSMLIGQDIVRREILGISDTTGNISIDLIKQMVTFGDKHYDVIILEGIFNKKKYVKLFDWLDNRGYPVLYYYFHLSFEETVRRHETKLSTDFGPKEMKAWWVEKDTIGAKNEVLFSDNDSEKVILESIMTDLKNVSEVE